MRNQFTTNKGNCGCGWMVDSPETKLGIADEMNYSQTQFLCSRSSQGVELLGELLFVNGGGCTYS